MLTITSVFKSSKSEMVFVTFNIIDLFSMFKCTTITF